MGNIIGEGFPSQIVNQVKIRQEKYGTKNRDNEVLTFLNSQTGWVRLGSSVDVKVDARKLGLLGSELAKQYVLFNGSSKYTKGETPTQRSGIISSSPTIHGDFAYGIGGNEMGLTPMPGITAVSTKTETRGSLKTSTIQIKCHNRVQFDIIDTLYLRLGFTMLLEWGHSSYFNNKGEYIQDNPYNLMDNFLGIGKKISYSEYYPEIESRRLNSNGNYDAIMGKVVNFNWSFNKDGSYDVTVILRSMGDVIESLRTNILLADKFNTDKAQALKMLENLDQEVKNLGPNTGATTTDSSGFQTLTLAQDNAYIPPTAALAATSNARINAQTTIDETTEGTEAYNKKQEQLAKEGKVTIYAEKDATSLGRWIYDNIDRFSKQASYSNGLSYRLRDGKAVFIRQKYQNDIPPHYFVRFKYLLDWIQKNIVPRTNTEPLFTIDTNAENNIIILAGRQYPTDNGVCQVSYNQEFSGGQILYYLGAGPNSLPFEITKGDNRYGKIMNIYFNVDFVLNSLKESSIDGKVALIDFLTKLCSGWNDTTGNYSKLEPTFVEESNTLRFTDENQLPDRDVFLKDSTLYNPPKSTELTYFNIYGYYPQTDGNSTAGFVSDFSFETSITPNLATMITIGANSNGQITGEDSTGVSRMNNGYKDRIKPIITSPGITNEEAEKSQEDSLEQDYTQTLKNLTAFLSEVGSLNNKTVPTFSPEIVGPFKTCIQTLIEFDQSKKTQNKNDEAEDAAESESNKITKYATASTGFLPFNLSLTMDGLSGMKVYQKFITDISFLPSNYPSSLEFLISGIENSIVGNKWETKIESIAVPKNPFSPKSNTLPVYEGRQRQSSGGASSTGTVEKTNKTITSGFPIKPTSYSNKTYSKNGIMIHYTAGWQLTDNGKSTIDVLQDRTDSGLSYHYIIDGAGHVEQIVPNNVTAYHAGASAGSGNISANSLTVGISLQNVGFGTSETQSSYGDVTKSSTNKSFNQTKLVRLVDWEGNEITYRGHSYAQEITDAQYTSLLGLIKTLQTDTNLSIPPLVWKGKETYEQIFPPSKKGVKTLSYNTSKSGLFSHNSSNKSKSDCLPTPKLIKLFKEVGNDASPKPKYLNLGILAGQIQAIFSLTDSQGADREALFTPFKGRINDDESGAVTALENFLKKPEVQNSVALFSEVDKGIWKRWISLVQIYLLKGSGKAEMTWNGTKYIVNGNF